jgi:hypothetical protein
LEDNVGLLNALIQPSASSLRVNWAVHVVLSNPLLPDFQISVLMDLCHGEYGDLLPANERLSLVRSLFEQRPQTAIEFCQKWIERYPSQVKPGFDDFNHPVDSINLLAENLFQVEVNKIAGKSHNLSELLDTEEEITKQLYSDLNNHHASQVSKFQKGKPFIEELTEIREQLTQPNGHKTSSKRNSVRQAKLALILANQGFSEDANQLLPQLGTPLPDDPQILYSIAKVSQLSGNNQRAAEAAALLLERIAQKQLNQTIDVWGDYLSLINLGTLFMDLHMPEQASCIFELSVKKCPNDSSLH